MTDHVVDLADVGFDRGAHIILRRELARLPRGDRLGVVGTHDALAVHLAVWCRQEGHELTPEPDPDVAAAWIRPGHAAADRWAGAERAGGVRPSAVVSRPPAHWGLAARGALVEPGGPQVPFDLDRKEAVWAEVAPKLYAQAAARQWDPGTAIDWDAPFELPAEIEASVVQVMTYLVENEQAALVIPARLLARVHPHFREVTQLLAVQAADEARHIEVFTRRATLRGEFLGTSSVSGRASLTSLLAEPDFSLASFLLSVLGEGSFLNLLSFLDEYAPDPVTRRVARLAHQDEARHVAFGVAHLGEQARRDPAFRGTLRGAVERRHDMLADTAGINQDVLDALTVLAAGSWSPQAIARGHAAVQRLQEEMFEGRRNRLVHLGFPPDEASELSALHTRNFM
ncbi:ferritin-like domain-containing protein [Sphaerisporangium fuscum]|uniref:ferritin-like domain-containing protein n=1 Tax=Sphaerisporangium fuscum TaxID=2835868 RepID=UPI001BDCF76A|nr:ferritin-like domain-containing protein [Sphaerisporangium fuscum]